MILRKLIILSLICVGSLNGEECKLSDLLKQRIELDLAINKELNRVKSQKSLKPKEVNEIMEALQHPLAEVPASLYSLFLRSYFETSDLELRESLKTAIFSIREKQEYRSLVESRLQVDLNQIALNSFEDTPIPLSKLTKKRKLSVVEGIHEVMIRESIFTLIENPELEKRFLGKQ